MQMRRVVPEWSGFDAPEHMVHLSSLPERLPGVDDPLPPLVDSTEWLTFKTDKRRREHLGGRLLLANAVEAWWKERASLGRTDELDVVRDEHRAPYLRWRPGLWRQAPCRVCPLATALGKPSSVWSIQDGALASMQNRLTEPSPRVHGTCLPPPKSVPPSRASQRQPSVHG